MRGIDFADDEEVNLASYMAFLVFFYRLFGRLLLGAFFLEPFVFLAAFFLAARLFLATVTPP